MLKGPVNTCNVCLGKPERLVSFAHHTCPCRTLVARATCTACVPPKKAPDKRDVIAGIHYELIGRKSEASDVVATSNLVYFKDPENPGKSVDIKLYSGDNRQLAIDFLREIKYNSDKAYPNGFSCKLKR